MTPLMAWAVAMHLRREKIYRASERRTDEDVVKAHRVTLFYMAMFVVCTVWLVAELVSLA